MNPDKKNRILGWYRVADADLEAATILIGQELFVYDILCFHCQQAAEKYLKSLVVFYDEDPPKVHDIRQLIAIILKKNEDILQISDAIVLNEYAVRYRYPDHLSITDKQTAIKALDISNLVMDFVRKTIGF